MPTKPKPYYYFIPLIGSILGIFEGAIWTVISLTGIIWHFSDVPAQLIRYQSDTYSKILNSHLFYSFIKERMYLSGFLIQPSFGVIIGLFLYFLVSLTWTILSICLYSTITRWRAKWSKKESLAIILTWIFISFLNIMLDLAGFIMLAYDYKLAIWYYNQLTEAEVAHRLTYLYSIMTYGIMMVLVARGFILWFINLIMIVLMAIVCYNNYFKADIENNIDVDALQDSSLSEFADDEASSRDDYLSRRMSEPTLTTERHITASTSSFGKFRLYRDVNYLPDPDIERRIRRYAVAPEQSII